MHQCAICSEALLSQQQGTVYVLYTQKDSGVFCTDHKKIHLIFVKLYSEKAWEKSVLATKSCFNEYKSKEIISKWHWIFIQTFKSIQDN